MYEDKTFDNIMTEMLTDIPVDVRTDENSLVYNALAKQATALEEAYASLSYLYDCLLPSTMDEDMLKAYGTERGIPYEDATYALVRAEFTGTPAIEVGNRFTCGNLDYTAIEMLETNVWSLQCETAGVIANTNFGSLTQIDYIDGFESGEIVSVITVGEDAEDIESYRTRVLASFQVQSFAGNKSAYREFINALTGVGACKPKRRSSTGGYIDIPIIASDWTAPTTTLIATVQNAVDPYYNTSQAGEGEGWAPICHKVLISGVTYANINISANLTYLGGYSKATCEEAVKAAIDAYFLEQAKTWPSFDYITIRVTGVEGAILSVKGIIDIANLTINGSSVNIDLGANEIPHRGELTID